MKKILLISIFLLQLISCQQKTSEPANVVNKAKAEKEAVETKSESCVYVAPSPLNRNIKIDKLTYNATFSYANLSRFCSNQENYFFLFKDTTQSFPSKLYPYLWEYDREKYAPTFAKWFSIQQEVYDFTLLTVYGAGFLRSGLYLWVIGNQGDVITSFKLASPPSELNPYIAVSSSFLNDTIILREWNEYSVLLEDEKEKYYRVSKKELFLIRPDGQIARTQLIDSTFKWE